MSIEDGSAGVRSASWVLRAVFAWIALAIVVWAITGFMGDFRRNSVALSSAETSGSVSATGAPAPGSAVTTVTDLLATSRGTLVLRAEPAESSDAVTTVAEGSTLEVLAKQGTWFRVKDVKGNVGWVPNDSKYITIKKK